MCELFLTFTSFAKMIVTHTLPLYCLVYFCLFVCVCVPPRHTQLPSGSMKILKTSISDNGLYMCVASNIAGNLTQFIELNVLGKFKRSQIVAKRPLLQQICDAGTDEALKFIKSCPLLSVLQYLLVYKLAPG